MKDAICVSNERHDGSTFWAIDHEHGGFLVSNQTVGDAIATVMNLATADDIHVLHTALLRLYARKEAAERTSRVFKITLIHQDHYDRVLVDGEPLDPGPSQRVFNHSPDGFSWGYGGSGPAQLALALLMHAGLDDATAVKLHQDFKFDHVAGWPNEHGTHEIDVDIDAWIAARPA